MHNYLMITLKIGKAICPVCDVKNSNRAFRQQVANWQLWGFFVEIKDWTKAEVGYFSFFKEKITLKHLKLIRS